MHSLNIWKRFISRALPMSSTKNWLSSNTNRIRVVTEFNRDNFWYRRRNASCFCSFLDRRIGRGSLSCNSRKVIYASRKSQGFGFCKVFHQKQRFALGQKPALLVTSRIFRFYDIRPLTRIRSAQWVSGSKLTGEPAYKNLQGSSKSHDIFRGD